MSTYAFNDKLEREKIVVVSGLVTTNAGDIGTMTFNASRLATEFGIDSANLGNYAVIGYEYAVGSVGGDAPTNWISGRPIQVSGSSVSYPVITKNIQDKTLTVSLYNEDSSSMRLYIRVYMIKVA